MDENDEALVFRDEKTFFQIVQTTPDWDEAVDMLKRARSAALALRIDANCRRDSRASNEYDRLLSKLNTEIKHFNEKIERTRLKDAVLAICGRDVLNQCLDWMLAERGHERLTVE